MKPLNPQPPLTVKATRLLALALLPALWSLAQVPPPAPEDPDADADAPPPAAEQGNPAAVNPPATNVPAIAAPVPAAPGPDLLPSPARGPDGIPTLAPGTNAASPNAVTDRQAAMRRAFERAMTNRLQRPPTNRVFTVPAPGLAATGTNLAPAVATPPITAPAAQPAASIPQPAPSAETVSSPPSGTPSGQSGPPPVEVPPDWGTLSFNNSPIDPILGEYSKFSGRTVLRGAALPANTYTIVSQGALTRQEVIQALEGALALNGVTLIPQGQKFVKAVASTTAINEGGAINKGDASELPDSETFVTQVVPLKIAKPSEVAQVFQSSFSKVQGGLVPLDANQILVIRDYASNVKRMLELIAKMDVVPETDYRLEVVPIKYGKVADLFDTMNSLISGSGGGVGRARSQTRPGQAPTSGRSAGGLQNVSRTGRSLTSGSGYQQNQQLTGQAGQLAQQAGQTGTTFQQRLNQALSRAGGADQMQLLADARIVPDERSNSLIVFANKQDMEMITNIVAKVDVLLAQVLIEGIVLAVNIDDTLNLGVSWLQNPKRFGNDFAGGGAINNGQNFLSGASNIVGSFPSGFTYFGRLGDDVSVAIQALSTDNKARVLQRPRIQTSHAVTGTFFTGSTVPYVTGFYNYGGYGSVGTQSQVEQIQVGSTISVTPYITPDGLVVMDVYQDLSQVEGFTLIDNNQVPTTSSRNAQATLSVRDGDTIMFGGYIQESKDDSKSGVPILKDIPALGALFRSKTHTYKRQELMLLLHVTVLKTPTEAGLQTRAEKVKLPGLYDAFKEFERDDDKLRAKVGLETNQAPVHP
jgi:general secretion pathway protein D